MDICLYLVEFIKLNSTEHSRLSSFIPAAQLIFICTLCTFVRVRVTGRWRENNMCNICVYFVD